MIRIQSGSEWFCLWLVAIATVVVVSVAATAATAMAAIVVLFIRLTETFMPISNCEHDTKYFHLQFSVRFQS